MRKRPEPSEYHSFYSTYVDCVPDGDIIDVLVSGGERAVRLFTSISRDKGSYAYAEGKWAVAEVMGHVVDTERLFGYRVLSMARGDSTPLPGMEQDDWVAGTDFVARGVPSIAKEFQALRAANIALFSSLTEEELSRTGVASGLNFTVRSLLYITAGHLIHHLRVLKEKYQI